MCSERTPLGLILLHALRMSAHPRSGSAEAWLALNGFEAVGTTVHELTALLGEAAPLAPPGEPFARPREQALLEALARVDHDPQEAERLLGFVPEKSRFTSLALLTELSRGLSAQLATRLRDPSATHEAPLH